MCEAARCLKCATVLSMAAAPCPHSLSFSSQDASTEVHFSWQSSWVGIQVDVGQSGGNTRE